MNKRGELRGLFHKYIERKKEESTRPNVHRPYPCYGGSGSEQRSEVFQGDIFGGTIYFYEWSNLQNTPRKFFTVESFDNFLKSSGIYLTLWQKDVIVNLNWVYIACRKGSKELVIRQSWVKLDEEINGKVDINISNTSHQGVEEVGRWFG